MNVINNDPSVRKFVNNDATLYCISFPRSVKVVHEDNKDERAVDGSKWHNEVGELSSIWSCKG